MDETILSIITPCFEPGSFLSKCVSSVLSAASSMAGIEHIIIDGDSGLHVQQELTRLERSHTHLSFLSEPDNGQSDALNKGVRMARGEWIGVLNCDDSYEPGLLDRLIPILTTEEDKCVHVGNCRTQRADGSTIGINSPNATTWRRLIIGEPWFHFPCNPCAYFYPKAVHDDIGLYDVGEDYVMDLDFLIRLSRILPFRRHDELWGSFLMHDDCKTSSLMRDSGLDENKVRVRQKHLNSAPLRERMLANLQKRILQSRFKWLLPTH